MREIGPPREALEHMLTPSNQPKQPEKALWEPDILYMDSVLLSGA